MNLFHLRRAAGPAAILAAAAALGGCGVGPYDEGTAASSSGNPAKDALAGYGAESPTRIQADPGGVGLGIFDERVDRDAEQTAAVYGLTYGNWSWETYATQHDQLARLAVGAQRRNLLSHPPDRQVIRALAGGRQMNIARLVATDTVASSAGSKTVIVVLRERAAQEGLADPAAHHAVYAAKVLRTSVGWRVSSWTLLRS